MNKREALRLVLMDALMEFRNTRTPVAGYVAKRYETHGEFFKKAKLETVAERAEMARKLLQNIEALTDSASIPASEYWVVYQKVGDREFCCRHTGSFLKIANSIGSEFTPITMEEYADPIDVDGELTEDEAIALLKSSSMKIAKDPGRTHYTITEWKKCPVVEEVTNG